MGWTASLIYQLKTGKEVKVNISGYDPVDMLSGHYVSYQIDWKKTDCKQFENNLCPQERFCNRKYRWDDSCRFYIPEKYAKELELALQQANRKKNTFEIVFSYNKSKQPIAKKLLINGNDYREYDLNLLNKEKEEIDFEEEL